MCTLLYIRINTYCTHKREILSDNSYITIIFLKIFYLTIFCTTITGYIAYIRTYTYGTRKIVILLQKPFMFELSEPFHVQYMCMYEYTHEFTLSTLFLINK
jgi:hypothetical protein